VLWGGSCATICAGAATRHNAEPEIHAVLSQCLAQFSSARARSPERVSVSCNSTSPTKRRRPAVGSGARAGRGTPRRAGRSSRRCSARRRGRRRAWPSRRRRRDDSTWCCIKAELGRLELELERLHREHVCPLRLVSSTQRRTARRPRGGRMVRRRRRADRLRGGRGGCRRGDWRSNLWESRAGVCTSWPRPWRGRAPPRRRSHSRRHRPRA